MCVVCGHNFERPSLPGNFVQLRKLCDRCCEIHRYCRGANHAPLLSEFGASSGGQSRSLCRRCEALRYNRRVVTCAHCLDEFIPDMGTMRLNGRGVNLCNDCHSQVKHCGRCNRFLPRTAFSIATGKACGLAGHCRECTSDKWSRSTPANRFRARATLYGISYEQYEEMLDNQADLCAICGQPETDISRGKLRTLAVDHNHSTGQIRNLLCGRCNKTLGLMNEDPARLRAAADYLERWSAAIALTG